MTAVVLLDLDGTLIDSGEGVVASLREGFVGAGLRAPDDDVLRSFIGPPIHDSARRVGVPPELHDAVVAGYQRAFAERGNLLARVFDGVPQALAALRDAGARLVVATAKPHTFAVPVLEHLGLAPLLDGVFGAPDDESDTKGQIIARALASVGPDVQAVMVGDREHDVEGARGNGLACVGVLWGFGDRAELEAAGARAVVAAPEELVAAVLRLVGLDPLDGTVELAG
ncbi:HAD hydrolase-like protein [Cellulomonas persica]|uniref:5'-nucleotidase n=1 Tax=Cellulomonas persica TaxID=76861 RepID=A0A510UNV5_9CELL|nr:HAD hydrolase-like protein [Cellulomonas persica]GEK16324.1 5'-nucleotidase [Cellulomonas persica]